MELSYQALIGKPVVAADGERLGRVADLVAEARGERLRVTGLLVGPGSLLRRISFERAVWLGAPPARKIPWSLVARVEREIHLRVDAAALEPLDEGEETVLGERNPMPEKTR